MTLNPLLISAVFVYVYLIALVLLVSEVTYI